MMETKAGRVRHAWSCGVAAIAALMLSGGCSNFLADRDRDIQEATQALAAARDDVQRAKAHSERGTAYSEKARFSRLMKGASKEECDRLFELALQDHNQAVALDPGSAQVYLNRGRAYYDRGSYEFVYNPEAWIVPAAAKSWLDQAAADFQVAVAKEPKNKEALDYLGLAHEEAGEEDEAVRAYTQEMALDSLGKQRLADAYCSFGFRHQQQKEYPAAAAAYQKSIEFGQADDKSCPYDPFASLVGIYTAETREYDKAWDVVARALKARRPVDPELVARLRRQSGRTD